MGSSVSGQDKAIMFARDYALIIKHAKKELGQHPAILTTRLVNNPYLLTFI